MNLEVDLFDWPCVRLPWPLRPSVDPSGRVRSILILPIAFEVKVVVQRFHKLRLPVCGRPYDKSLTIWHLLQSYAEEHVDEPFIQPTKACDDVEPKTKTNQKKIQEPGQRPYPYSGCWDPSP